MDKDLTFIKAQELAKTNWVHASHLLREEAEKYPKDPRYQIALGDLLIKRHSFKNAVQHYLVALALDPANQQLLALIANCYLALGENRLALAYFNKILDPTDEVLYNKAITLAYLAKHSECVDILQKILPRFPGHPFLYYLLIEQNIYLQDYEQALFYVNVARKNVGQHRQLHILSAMVYNGKGQRLMEYNQYRLADEIKPLARENQLADYGAAAKAAGLWKQALEIYERVVILAPYLSEAWAEIIRLHLERGNILQAKRYLKKAKQAISFPSSMLRLLEKKINSLS